MNKILAIDIPNRKGYSLGLFQREHKITPYIVCGIDPDGKPMDDLGFDGYISIDDPEAVLLMAYNKLASRMFNNKINK